MILKPVFVESQCAGLYQFSVTDVPEYAGSGSTWTVLKGTKPMQAVWM